MREVVANGPTRYAGAMSEYSYTSTDAAHTSDYLMPIVMRAIDEFPAPRRIFELGCGNGANARILADLGYEVVGVDASASGIEQARSACPDCTLMEGSAYDPLAAKFGRFDVVVSLEVVEHL